MTDIHPVALRKLLAERFSLEELYTLCFDLGENAEVFAGRVSKAELASKIVTHFQDRDKLPTLLYQVERERSGMYARYLATEQALERERAQQGEAQVRQNSRKTGRQIRILHLSDIHLGTAADALKYRSQLEADLLRELGVNRLDYVVISGDVADHSTPDDYGAASGLVDGLVKRFGLEASQIVIAPGNHDLNWDLAAEAYNHYVPGYKLHSPPPEGTFIPTGDTGALLHDEGKYQQRFARFADFYKKLCGNDYPLGYEQQGLLHLRSDDGLVFLTLNSAWALDHHYRQRASIHMEALANALNPLLDAQYDHWLKIAVWHHPVTGREGMNDEFVQQLTVQGFQVCLHGHIHEAIEGFYKYDNKRGIHIVGAGTFGAPRKEQVTGIPLQYNLLVYEPENHAITVETRKKEKPDGAWSADARWGDKNNPKPRYTIKLK